MMLLRRILALFRRRRPAPLPPRPADQPRLSPETVAALLRNSNALRRVA